MTATLDEQFTDIVTNDTAGDSSEVKQSTTPRRGRPPRGVASAPQGLTFSPFEAKLLAAQLDARANEVGDSDETAREIATFLREVAQRARGLHSQD